MQTTYSYLFKYIIIGDASVGKSCLLMQFLEGKFREDSQPTIGVQFGSKCIDLGENKLKVQIWDTAGQQIFKSVTRSYYRGSIGAILVYDITNRQSFNNLDRWIEETRSYANDKISVILVGNKNDLPDKNRQVQKDEGLQYAIKHHMLFCQCSATSFEKTEEIFNQLAKEVLNKIDQKIIDPKNQTLGIKIGSLNGERNKRQRRLMCC